MSATPAFFGYVNQHGKLILDDRAGFLAEVRSFTGQPVELSVRKRRSKRSLDQNAWLWGVAIPLIADHCGYDKHEHDRLHYDLLATCFGTVEAPGRVPGSPALTLPRLTSSQLTTKDFSDYMEWLVRFAASDLGVRVPLPGESEAA